MGFYKRFSAERMSGAEVVESLRGKVLEKEEKEDGQQWTPYNANMSMQGIKVLVKEPLPAEAKKSGDSFEDTMLLLDIVRERKKKQNENKKEEMIRAMAMEQKKKKQMKENSYIHRPEISNINLVA